MVYVFASYEMYDYHSTLSNYAAISATLPIWYEKVMVQKRQGRKRF